MNKDAYVIICNYKGSAESDLCTSKIPGIIFANFQEILKFFSNFLKFRRNSANFSAKKHAIWTCSEQNLAKSGKIAEILQNLRKSSRIWVRSGAKVCQSCRSRKMLKNDYLLAKIGFDTAENEPSKVWTCLPAPSPPLIQLRMIPPSCWSLAGPCRVCVCR